eukprot:scaffold3294_cov126-Skeletonema_dohrnii-CCMP3373.AAC.4
MQQRIVYKPSVEECVEVEGTTGHIAIHTMTTAATQAHASRASNREGQERSSVPAEVVILCQDSRHRRGLMLHLFGGYMW